MKEYFLIGSSCKFIRALQLPGEVPTTPPTSRTPSYYDEDSGPVSTISRREVVALFRSQRYFNQKSLITNHGPKMTEISNIGSLVRGSSKPATLKARIQHRQHADEPQRTRFNDHHERESVAPSGLQRNLSHNARCCLDRAAHLQLT